MFQDSEKPHSATVDEGNRLNVLTEQLHLLEVETFEIEDFVELEQNPAAMSGNCFSCVPPCSCTPG